MNKYKLIATLSIVSSFLILSAMEGDAIGIVTAALLIIPMEGLMIWAFNRSGWIDTEAVEADMWGIKAAIKKLWKGGEKE